MSCLAVARYIWWLLAACQGTLQFTIHICPYEATKKEYSLGQPHILECLVLLPVTRKILAAEMESDKAGPTVEC